MKLAWDLRSKTSDAGSACQSSGSWLADTAAAKASSAIARGLMSEG